jgi:protein arginine kinase activator
MKCQRCSKAATLHITEITGENQFDELHLCEECAQKYLQPQSNNGSGGSKESAGVEADELAALNRKECPSCGIKFLEFRNTGRLGCAHDYEAFREELLPLLENIHGEPRHIGKTPRRQPQARQTRAELSQLRKQLQQAVNRENYEEAARIRDKIRLLEEG